MSDTYRKRPATRRKIARLSKRARHDRQTHYLARFRAANKRDREEAKAK